MSSSHAKWVVALRLEKFPACLVYSWMFALVNGLSFPIIQGSPVFVYAKSLNANATILGFIVSLTPLLITCQIPAAQFIDRFGYKRFALSGWKFRIIFILGLCLIPLTSGYFGKPMQLALAIVMLFGFNLLRGISTAAWLPWFAALVPGDMLGSYVLGDIAMANLGSFFAVNISALLLLGEPQPWRFSLIFAWSAAMGVASLWVLNRIPDAPIPEHQVKSGEPVPWKAMILHPPFRKLLQFVMAWAIAFGGITVFTVSYLKTQGGMDPSRVLMVTSVAFLGGMSTLWFLGNRLDHFGSKPVVAFSILVWLALLSVWIVIAGGLVKPGIGLVLVLQFCMGLFAALVTMSNNRLAMAIIPVMGRNHFFAIYSVVLNLALGLSPIAWGAMIDLVGTRHWNLMGLSLNRYTLFYLGAMAVFLLALVLAGRLEEPKARSLEELLRHLRPAATRKRWPIFWSGE